MLNQPIVDDVATMSGNQYRLGTNNITGAINEHVNHPDVAKAMQTSSQLL